MELTDIGDVGVGVVGFECLRTAQLGEVTGVDDEAEAEFLLDKNIVANCKVSFKENLANSCKIYGTKGSIIIPSPWLPSTKSYIEVYNENSYYKNFISSNKSIYAIQIESISRLFNEEKLKKTFQVEINESVEILTNLDKWKSGLF